MCFALLYAIRYIGLNRLLFNNASEVHVRWLLVDAIDELVINERVVGRKTYDSSEEFFQDHFPGFPVVPGVLLMESLAQLAGKMIGYSVLHNRGDWPFPILTMMNNVKFRKFVPPGTEITLVAELTSLRDDMAAVKVKAKVGKKTHAQAEQIFAFNAVSLEDQAAQHRVELLESNELKRLWADCPADIFSHLKNSYSGERDD